MSQDSGEKTEKASPKKKKDAREKGEVHKSNDLASALTLLITFSALKVGYDGFMNSMEGFMTTQLSSDIAQKAVDVTGKTIVSGYKEILLTVAPIVLPIMLVAMVAGVVVDVAQTGPLFVIGKLKPDFQKINPIQGFKRIFSTNTLAELVKSIVKIVILGWVIYKYVSNNLEAFSELAYVDVGKAFARVMSGCFSLGIQVGLVLVGFAAVDVLYQWWKYEKDLRMTKQEVKEEMKQLEGDPLVKSKVRQKQRRMSSMRMMKKIPEADVIVTNPDHFAVALRYKENIDKAPRVVAKGQDYLAQRIKETARKYNIAIVENRPVARALYASCEIDEEIPPELYQAIADILIYVYKTAGNERSL